MTPTDEQIAILDLFENSSSNIMINALAGTGKTTTLDLIQENANEAPILCLAFNKRAAEEMEKKFGSGTTTVRTLNGLGHRIWAKTVAKINVEPQKMSKLFKEHTSTLTKGERNEAWEVYWEVLQGVSMAKALGYVPEGVYPGAKRLINQGALGLRLEEKPSSITLDLIDTLLTLSIRAAYKGWIDYNDQIYMPALFGGTFPRFPLVLIDEAQDLNPVNHAMLQKLVRGRLGCVGDPWQSIYAFRGAVTQGMQQIKERFNCEESDLSISFRCPQAIVNHARWRVPTFKSNKPGGTVDLLQTLEAKTIPEGAAIVCRNNAPLFRSALSLLMCGRSVSVSGSEIGPKLIRLLGKICSDQDDQETMLGKIEAWKIEKLENSQSPGQVHDTAECLKVFAGFGQTLTQAVAYVEHMFKQQGAIKLLTGHKAKGGEWNIVYFLDEWLCKEDEQDLNLKYVIQTRSADRLYYINSVDIKW